MAFGTSSTQLLGTISEPRIGEMPDGTTTAEFGLAVNRMKRTQDGDFEETTQWHNVKCYDDRAEYVERRVEKGDVVHVVDAQFRTERYEDRNGVDRTDVHFRVAGDLQVLNNKPYDPEAELDREAAKQGDDDFEPDDGLPF